jgi:hypothetical protein
VGKTNKEGILLASLEKYYNNNYREILQQEFCPLLLSMAQKIRPCMTQQTRPCMTQQIRPPSAAVVLPNSTSPGLLLYILQLDFSCCCCMACNSASVLLLGTTWTRFLSLLYDPAKFDLSPSCQTCPLPPNRPSSLLLKCVPSPLTPTLHIFIFTQFPP